MIIPVMMKGDNRFYIEKHSGEIYPYSIEAEGAKKIGLLWQLLMTKAITEGAIVQSNLQNSIHE